MHAERDLLQNYVFPELGQRLRRRRHHLEPIDLRWGIDTAEVADEHARQLRVLKVCLTEIQRSLSVIVLLGDRYGWIPPVERTNLALQEAGLSPICEGRSITATEIEAGILEQSEVTQQCHFYFRELPYDDMDAEAVQRYRDPPDQLQKLERLKDRIAAEFPDRVHRYSPHWDATRQTIGGLRSWAQQVVLDVWKDLDLATAQDAEAAEPTWENEERWLLEAFIEQRAAGFVGRTDLCRELRALARGEDLSNMGLTIVTGPAGSGKSALFAQLCRILDREPNVLVLAHAAGISVRSSQTDSLLQLWGRQLAEAAGTSWQEDPQAGTGELRERFQRVLESAAQCRPVVLLLDAVDQLQPQPEASYLTWLPSPPPSGVRCICTALPAAAACCRSRFSQVRAVELPPLTEYDVASIADGYSARRHRQLNAQVLDTIRKKRTDQSKAAAGNPLWLELALGQLHNLDADDFQRTDTDFAGTAEQRLLQLVLDVTERLPADLGKLYHLLLQRAEKTAGRQWVQRVLSAIALSRSGLRVGDLRELVPVLSGEPWSDLQFALLTRSFGGHLIQRGVLGEWDFAHAHARQAVRRYYVYDEATERQLHRQIAEHLFSLVADDALRQRELMVHLLLGGEDERAARYLVSDMLRPEGVGASRSLAEHIMRQPDREAATTWVQGFLAATRANPEEHDVLLARALGIVFIGLANIGTVEVRLLVAEAVRDELARHAGTAGESPERALLQQACLLAIGDLHRDRGALGESQAAYEEARALAERQTTLAPDRPDCLEAQSDALARLADVLRKSGEIEKASAAGREARAIAERRKELLKQQRADHAGFVEEACAKALKEAIDIRSAILPDQRSYVAETEDGFKVRVQAEPTRVRVPGFQDLLLRGDGTDESPFVVQLVTPTAETMERVAAMHRDASTADQDLIENKIQAGDRLREQRQYVEAQQEYESAVEQAAAAVESAKKDERPACSSLLAFCQYQLAWLHLTCERWDEAMQVLKPALAIEERLAQDAPHDRARRVRKGSILTGMSYALSGRGEHAEALGRAREAEQILLELVTEDPSHGGWQRALGIAREAVGLVLQQSGQLVAAEDHYLNILREAQRWANQHPDNSQMLHDVLHIRRRLAALRVEQDDPREAVAEGRQCLRWWRNTCSSQGNWEAYGTLFMESLGTCIDHALYEEGATLCDEALPALADHVFWGESLEVGHVATRVQDLCERLAEANQVNRAADVLEQLQRCLASWGVKSEQSGWRTGMWLVCYRLGCLQRRLGQTERAITSLNAALQLTRHMMGAEDAPLEPRSFIVGVAISLGNLYLETGDCAKAAELFNEVRRTGLEALERDPQNETVWAGAAWAETQLSRMFAKEGQWAEAIQLGATAVEHLEGWVKVSGNAAYPARELVGQCRVLGQMLVHNRRFPQAAEVLLRAKRAAQRLVSDHQAQSPDLIWDLVQVGSLRGEVLSMIGERESALEEWQEAIAAAATWPPDLPMQPDSAYQISLLHNHVGNVLLAQRDATGSLAHFDRARRIRQQLVDAQPDNAAWHHALSFSHEKRGDVFMACGQPAEAYECFRAGLTALEQALALDSDNDEYRRDLGALAQKMGDALLELGHPAAIDLFVQSLVVVKQRAEQDPGNPSKWTDVAATLMKLVLVEQSLARETEVRKYVTQFCAVIKAMKQAQMPTLPDHDETYKAWREILDGEPEMGG